jgi:Right handed beta helix region
VDQVRRAMLRIGGRRRLLVLAIGVAPLIALPSLALAHIERASYWPDPAPDASVTPPAGGAVPSVRSLYTALDTAPPGDTRVVCQPDSMQRLNASLVTAQTTGYKIRASQPAIKITKQDAQKLKAFNQKLFSACTYNSIQAAVTDSHNNDRVEVMPGLYTEPASRAAPTNDPSCADLRETNDKGSTGAVSYRYQFHCPNDQNLIAVIGRAPATDASGNEVAPPQPPLEDRHGIPDNGPCIRCNLQIQGTGVGPDDVIVDGGDPSLGDAGAPGPDPVDYSKDVGIRADRADGFVLDNLKVRHVNEHGIYVIETDGFNLNRFKTAYAKEYGVLTFVADHSIIHNCDAVGSGDAGLYPGATADTWDAVPESERRRSNVVADCDSHHNAAGYSGTDGNAVWIHDNNFYDNTLGFTTDVFTAPGHPGFPQDSDLIENNNFYSNNFNLYLPVCGPGQKPGPYGPDQGCSDVVPTVPEPVGTGLWIAGGNHNIVRNNHFWDNWRRGTMLFSVPDQFVCGPAGVDPSQLAGCDPAKVPPSTSYNNEFYGNVMGRSPSGTKARNGVDFWWDSYASNTGNCWHDNTGVNGDRASLTATPPLAPVAGQSLPGFLPEDCATSVGTGGPAQEAELMGCFASITFDSDTCPWFTTPPKP